jgi:hypothetical protein
MLGSEKCGIAFLQLVVGAVLLLVLEGYLKGTKVSSSVGSMG